jgi:hypothetical protein
MVEGAMLPRKALRSRPRVNMRLDTYLEPIHNRVVRRPIDTASKDMVSETDILQRASASALWPLERYSDPGPIRTSFSFISPQTGTRR